ncbi:MAG: cytochrome c [Planctomycetes bacterium]|nr:cytochrome c [Planctomycetota bacterium]
MSMHARLLAVSGALLALAVWFGLIAGPGNAADDETNPKDAIAKMADALERGNPAAAQAGVASLKDAEPDDIMPVFDLRTAKGGGLGLGPTRGAIQPDGIEKMIQQLAKTAPTSDQLARESKDLLRAAYVSQAVAQVIPDKCPVKVKTGEKDPNDWKTWTADMATNSTAFADAVKSGDPEKVHAAAMKLDASCTACHNVFKE